MKSSRNFQTELNNLKNEMLSHIKRNLPIKDINERIDVIVDGWDGSYLKTMTVESINEKGHVLVDNGGIYDLDEVCVYDLAWLCDYYCKK
jgi:hypothetical protein